MSLIGLLLFGITLGILVFVHEMGHFLAAKSVGVRVDEFAFGFGPKLVTLLRRGGTEYTVRALPLGGFVSMAGMQPEETGVTDGLMSKPAWARAWVFVAGPLMNVLLALLVFCSMGMLTGAPQDKQSTQVWQVTPTTVDGHPSEAVRIGLRTGDVIVAIDGVPMKDGEQLIKVIQSHPGQLLHLLVRRGAQTLELQATPHPEPREPHSKVIVGRLGFEPGVVFKRLGFAASVRAGFRLVANNFLVLKLLFQHPKILKESTGGPISMLRATNINSKLDPAYQYSLVGQLSLSLAIFNLLPIPVLDGGHLAILLVEVFSGLVWRRKLGMEVYRVATAIGLMVIVALFLFLTVSDVSRWFHGKPLP